MKVIKAFKNFAVFDGKMRNYLFEEQVSAAFFSQIYELFHFVTVAASVAIFNGKWIEKIL